MDVVTKNLAIYVKKKHVNVSAMARDTGIPYSALYSSLLNEKRDRDIKGKELIAICRFLDVDPMKFADDPEENEESRPVLAGR